MVGQLSEVVAPVATEVAHHCESQDPMPDSLRDAVHSGVPLADHSGSQAVASDEGVSPSATELAHHCEAQDPMPDSPQDSVHSAVPLADHGGSQAVASDEAVSPSATELAHHCETQDPMPDSPWDAVHSCLEHASLASSGDAGSAPPQLHYMFHKFAVGINAARLMKKADEYALNTEVHEGLKLTWLGSTGTGASTDVYDDAPSDGTPSSRLSQFVPAVEVVTTPRLSNLVPGDPAELNDFVPDVQLKDFVPDVQCSKSDSMEEELQHFVPNLYCSGGKPAVRR